MGNAHQLGIGANALHMHLGVRILGFLLLSRFRFDRGAEHRCL
jgi:hypothetical protein